MVVAIDGPGGVGKSTTARAVAAALELPYLDTGSTYRAATLAALRAGVALHDEAAVLEAVAACQIDYDGRGILLDGQPVSSDVRSQAVTAHVSEVSAHPAVRSHIVDIQRRWVEAHRGDAVVEGRDIGTVVFPDAPVKVFLTARPEVRAQRRAGDVESGSASVSDIAKDLERRDTADASRAASPMKAADDAVVIDTSDHTVDEVVADILTLVDATGSDAEE